MNVSTFLAIAAVAAASGSVLAQCSNYSLSPAGTVLLDADDAIRNVALPFAFPFNGNVYTSITVSTNGWIKLGQATATSSELTDSEALMLSGDPRIAVCWDDLNAGPTGMGDVFYSADATQASVTWQGVQRFGLPTALANCECILLPSGEIVLNYDSSCTFNLTTSSSIVGISAGGNSVAAGTHTVNWTTANPGPVAVTNATAYELFTAVTGANPFDLTGGVVLHFVPTGVDTFNVTQVGALAPCMQQASYPGLAVGPTVVGVGCPTAIPNGSIYEAFTINTGANPLDTQNTSMRFAAAGETYTVIPGPGIDPSYTSGTPLTLGDETMMNGVSVGAMSVFPFGDLLVTAVNISSNGFLRLDGNTANDFTPTPAEFNTQGPRIAGCWKDLNPGAGGMVYLNDTNPNFFMVTFDAVPEFANAPSLCTFQIKMYANGDIDISHGQVDSISDAVIVGITRGAAMDPGSSNLVTMGAVNTIGPIDIVGQTPMSHTSTQLAIGKPFSMSATVANSLGLGFFIVGESNPNLPLDPLGATGCSLYASLSILYVQPILGSTFTTNLPTIPYVPAYSGAVLYTQAAAFSNVNSFGFVLSNGLMHTVGL